MKWTKPIAFLFGCLALLGVIEVAMGRSLLGPDGRFGFWEGNIWSNENSQRLADPYSFSHIVHGISFYALLWLVARKLPMEKRIFIALILETGWEVLENSPIIINRYRETTISLGYVGDSVLNSMSDVTMMFLGFLLASRIKPLTSLAAVIIMEVGCALWIRDNLTLNLIMLIHPVNAIKTWQMAAQPHP